MKNYYQQKGMGFVLPQPIYRKTVNTIRAYNFYQSLSNQIDEDGEINKSLDKGKVERLAVNAAMADFFINAIHEALKAFVAEEYREAVLIHLADDVPYCELEEKYGISISTLKRWTQRFVYGVATELGENYFGE